MQIKCQSRFIHSSGTACVQLTPSQTTKSHVPWLTVAAKQHVWMCILDIVWNYSSNTLCFAPVSVINEVIHLRMIANVSLNHKPNQVEMCSWQLTSSGSDLSVCIPPLAFYAFMSSLIFILCSARVHRQPSGCTKYPVHLHSPSLLASFHILWHHDELTSEVVSCLEMPLFYMKTYFFQLC